MRTRVPYLLALLLILVISPVAFAAENIVRLATTTSTDNSGLLKQLIPPFESNTGYRVHVIAVGTGKALRLAREGDVDVVLVHARQAEDRLVAEGYGTGRRDVMYNDFVIVGPPADPAGLAGTDNAILALQKIAHHGSLFVSRGDDSGTHKKERQLWHTAGVTPGKQWYREAGQGMGKVLQIASELDAYTITDRGTWLAYRDKVALKILAERDPGLYNPYGIIAVNPEHYPDINHAGAMALINWFTSDEGQKRIGSFRIGGEPLFTPSAVPNSVAGAPSE